MVTFHVAAQGGIGDCLVATALIREYHRVNPDEIIVLDKPPVPEIFIRNPHLGRGSRRNGEVIKVYCMDRSWEGTAVAMNCSRLGIVPHNELPEIFLDADERGIPFGLSAAQEARSVAIDVCAGWPSRIWSLERFRELARRLMAAGWYVVQVGKHSKEMEIPCDKSFVNRLTVRETAELLSRMQLFLGNESGLTHLSAAMETPQVVIYGLSIRWQAPYASGVAVHPRAACDRACWDNCVRDGVPGLRHCLDEISVDQVLAGVDVARERFELAW